MKRMVEADLQRLVYMMEILSERSDSVVGTGQKVAETLENLGKVNPHDREIDDALDKMKTILAKQKSVTLELDSALADINVVENRRRTERRD